MSGETLTPTHVEEAVELAEQQSGNTTRTLVPIPPQVSDAWDLKYDEYIRISLISAGETPVLSLAPMGDMRYRQRNNDLKLTSNEAVALPRRIVRAFGMAGDVWWEEFDNQLVGRLTEYSDASSLYQVVNYYTTGAIPHDDNRQTTFTDLREVADKEYQYSEDDPHGIYTNRGAIRHSVPDDFGIEEEEELVFTLFHDGTSFLIGLIPYEGADADEDATPFFKYQYNPMSASPGSTYESLPSVLLDYEKDKVMFHRDRNETTYYTVPKQVASCLWLDDGYVTDWLKLDGMYLARLTPESASVATERADSAYVPQ